MIQNWIEKKHLKNLNLIKQKFLNNSPFEHISINNFLIEKKAEKLLKELNKLEYYIADSDLYKFKRTKDLANINLSNSKYLLEFKKLILSKEFIQFIEKITNTKINPSKIALHSLKLEQTHYLLCHDDLVEKRKIAFILNLSKNWKKTFGGELELFNTKNKMPNKVVKKIIPSFNQFNMFLVSEKSYHQISEVLENKQRISISGWFY